MVEALIRLCVNARPSRTTLATWVSRPIKESRSRFVPDHLGVLVLPLPIQCSSSDWSLCSFSLGNLTSLAMVSVSMPRNVDLVVGPSVFPGATGRPTLAHVASVHSSAALHAWESAGPQSRKSSR